MTPHALRRKARKLWPIVIGLDKLAVEFDAVAAHYSKFKGEHNGLLEHEARRAAAQLRFVSVLVVDGFFTQEQGYDWVRAAHRIICAIGRSNVA